jgi:ribosome-binding protein aMBF1 (putative translation factor)
MSNKKTTADAVKILDKTFVKGSRGRRRAIQKERQKLDIAQEIYDMRTNTGLTQKELADLVGTKQSVISRLEDADYGRHSLKMLNRIAEAMNCRLEVHMVPNAGGHALA